MIKKFFKKIHLILKIDLCFDIPKKNKLLLFDESHSSILKKIIKKNFNILNVRNKKIYFWILLKQIIFFDFSFLTYCKNYIRFISPKIVITFIDTNIQFYELKNSFHNINFISVQNGSRWDKNTMPIFYNKNIKSKKLKCDHVFVYSNFYIKEYQGIIDSKFHVLGNFKNNIFKIHRTKIKNDFLLISSFIEGDLQYDKFERKLFNYINLYLKNFNKKIYILPRNKNYSKLNVEIDYYKNFFKSRCIFQSISDLKNSHSILDKFENIIFTYSSMGLEAISRKKKVAIFSPIKDINGKLNPVWPAPYQKKFDFFSSKVLIYNEVKRVLHNVSNCSQMKWKRNYYNIIKDQLFLDKDNTKLKKVIFKLL